MKILYISHQSGEGFGGACHSLLTLIDYFQNENEIFVVVPYGYGQMYEELKKRKCTILVNKFYWSFLHKNNNKLKWGIHRIIWYLYQKLWNKKQAKILAKFIKENDIEIVHTNSSVVDVGAKAAMLAGCKHIWHIREFCQEDFGLYSLGGEQSFIKLLKNSSHKILAVSNAVKDKYKDYLKENQIVTVYNGIKTPIDVKHEEHNTFNLLISGMVSEAKGQKMALDAMKELMQKGYNDIHLYIAGKGNTKQLEEEIASISENIHFLGYVKDMVKLREKIDVELVCSRAEAFGRVTVEAMMSEIPVIGSNSGGTGELIQDGINGFLFERGNVTQLVNKIIYMYVNKTQVVKMGKDARKIAEEKYSIKNCVCSVEKIYKEVIAR